ncbi:hypothetical protein CAPTEDRAFT_173068 [Capitella teleta]|uniref:Major facilitator superfamily (MFS) profile domain-containing protein n=1 Tax=Capitella teleta TaxID=283909 RepID=R7U6P3_CAPTE|nr:hypothetical protein CAPTEDRAFT_173068 [Capitella teleta]|eukprot:ELT99316.1 hypothetical protein CAPTEDRAFT_173068 [Capitella teleta]
MSRVKTIVPPDGAWGWVVLLGSFVAYFIADGWSYSFGIIFPSLLSYFEESRGKTALIAALLYGVPLLVSPIVCALTEAYGCRVVAMTGGLLTSVAFVVSSFAQSVDFLCFSIGILSSVGLSMIYVPSIVIVTCYFEKRRGLATGLAVTGSGLGAFAFPPLIEFLIEQYGWRQTLFLFGAIWLHVIPAGALFRPPPVVYTQSANAEESVELRAEETADVAASRHGCCWRFWREFKSLIALTFDKTLALSKPYLVFTAATFLLYLFVGMPYVYLMDKALIQGVQPTNAAFLFSIIGIGRTIGQVLLGFAGDSARINTLFLYGLALAIAGVGTVLVPVCYGYSLLGVFSFTFGFFVSVTYTLQMMCLVLMVGLERSTGAFGLLQMVQGIATLLGTPIAGWLYEATESYDVSFYVAGAWVFVSGLVLCVLPRIFKNRQQSSLSSL